MGVKPYRDSQYARVGPAMLAPEMRISLFVNFIVHSPPGELNAHVEDLGQLRLGHPSTGKAARGGLRRKQLAGQLVGFVLQPPFRGVPTPTTVVAGQDFVELMLQDQCDISCAMLER